MKITIDFDDRHTIDGGEYVRVTTVAMGEKTKENSVEIKETHGRSVKIKNIPGNRDESRRALQLAKEANHDYDDRRAERMVQRETVHAIALTDKSLRKHPSRRRLTQWTEERVQKVVEMVRGGAASTQIAKALGVTSGAMSVKLSEMRKKGLVPPVRQKQLQPQG